MSFFGSIANIGKSIIKSPITATVAGGVAIAFPAVGVPAVAAVAVANRALAAAESPAGRAVTGAAAGVLARKRVKASLVAGARRQLKAGVPKAKVKATMLRKAHAAARVIRASSAKQKQQAPVVSQHRQQLAAQLKRTAQLAAKGDPGAKRALATFKVVAAARKGDPKARAAVATIAHRWEVGQRVRSRFTLTSHGRIRARV